MDRSKYRSLVLRLIKEYHLCIYYTRPPYIDTLFMYFSLRRTVCLWYDWDDTDFERFRLIVRINFSVLIAH